MWWWVTRGGGGATMACGAVSGSDRDRQGGGWKQPMLQAKISASASVLALLPHRTMGMFSHTRQMSRCHVGTFL